ncbi:MAG TPA: tetratricopeptide repeat protein, partial [Isosphaeraceae bacterium]|nr:tetratricopeptide repeat protein [Isosphaeraceae bacterium]
PQTQPADHTASSDDELQKGIDLFQQGRYREAREVFDHVTKTTAPDDARAWYFDALATGLSTGDWKEAAPRLARQGIEREKAGTPPSDKIDEALEDLTEPTGRDWIASFRNKVNP